MQNYVGYIYKITIPTSEGERYYWGRKISSKIIEWYWGGGVKLKHWVKNRTDGKINSTTSMSSKIAAEIGLTREIIGF